MAIFFLVVGLEIKRELVDGRLQAPRTAALPVLAAVGGVVAPIVIFVVLIAGGEGSEGWAIACATDIAFAVGLVSLLGDRVSEGARVFLLAVAIVDDIIAIAIIAGFFGGSIAVAWLAAAVVLVVLVRLLPRAWVPLAIVLWIAVHESGVHATIAGVAVGLLLPVAMGERIEHRLHPWSAFVVVPLFALANAGIDFGGGVLGQRARQPADVGDRRRPGASESCSASPARRSPHCARAAPCRRECRARSSPESPQRPASASPSRSSSPSSPTRILRSSSERRSASSSDR